MKNVIALSNARQPHKSTSRLDKLIAQNTLLLSRGRLRDSQLEQLCIDVISGEPGAVQRAKELLGVLQKVRE